MPNRNDPYSRPINATRTEGQMLQGAFYGERASDKALHRATRGQAVHQVRAMQSVVPTWPDEQPEKPKRTRSKRATTPSPDATSPSDTESSPTESVVTTQSDAITEDDLFG